MAITEHDATADLFTILNAIIEEPTTREVASEILIRLEGYGWRVVTDDYLGVLSMGDDW